MLGHACLNPGSSLGLSLLERVVALLRDQGTPSRFACATPLRPNPEGYGHRTFATEGWFVSMLPHPGALCTPSLPGCPTTPAEEVIVRGWGGARRATGNQPLPLDKESLPTAFYGWVRPAEVGRNDQGSGVMRRVSGWLRTGDIAEV
jgi:hypothetical protein